MNQQLVDYTVRNITTGDEEDIRTLELDPDEMLEFPEQVRDEVIALIDDAQQTGSHWDANQQKILDLLLPFISRPEQYRSDYEAWENEVLGIADEELAAADREWARRALARPAIEGHSPEDVEITVRHILVGVVEMAIENWREGYWDEFTEGTPTRDVMRQLAGYIDAYLEDPDIENQPFMDVEPA